MRQRTVPAFGKNPHREVALRPAVIVVVITGLDPVIHLYMEKLDCRVEPGNDEGFGNQNCVAN
jgi:hypothetical protein